jgi:hypothetical protein
MPTSTDPGFSVASSSPTGARTLITMSVVKASRADTILAPAST